MPKSSERFIVTRRFGVTKLTRNAEGFWQSEDGCLYAFQEGPVADEVNRCGVWPFALPNWAIFKEMNDACAVHDYLYSSPVYQALHSREEADKLLKQLLTIVNHPLFGEIAKEISRIKGPEFWENALTR